jgi:toxin YoeB
MAFKEIVWSELAVLEFTNILEFYIEHNGSVTYSSRLLLEVEELTQTLAQSEFIGRITENKITRVISLKHYSLFYEINFDRIEIVSFWDNRQNPVKRKVK